MLQTHGLGAWGEGGVDQNMWGGGEKLVVFHPACTSQLALDAGSGPVAAPHGISEISERD